MTMPLIMDNENYMDDLFGDNDDPAPLTAPIISVKGLQTRLDELRTLGCCCKIAWSAQNCIASITDDGDERVTVRTLIRRPEDCEWVLSDRATLKIPQLREEFQPIHISWSPLGSDLAVSDVLGRVLIFNLGYAQGKMQIRGSSPLDGQDETGVIVGLRWLPILPVQQRFNMFRFVTRDNDNKWVYRLSSHKRLDPSNPLDGKSAMFMVTMNGSLRLLFQQVDGRWNEVKSDLELVSSSQDCLTHAAIGCDSDGSYYVVAVNLMRQLQLYSIRVDWRSSQSQQASQKPIQVSPAIVVRPVLLTGSDRLCAPLPMPNSGDEGNEQNFRNMALPQLSHLIFMPAAPETVGQGMAKVSILAIFSYVCGNSSSPDASQSQNDQFSVLCRWEIVKSKATIHPIFERLASKTNNSTTAPTGPDVISLRRLSDIVVDGVIITATLLYNDTVLSLSYSDGLIEFRNRPSLDVIKADHNYNQISSLPQSGFSFPTNNQFLHSTLSPNNCLAAHTQTDGLVKLLTMKYALGSFDSYKDDPKTSAAIVALAMQHCYSCMGYHSADDIIAVMARDTSKVWERFFLSQAYQSLNTGVDFMSEESQKQAHFLFQIMPLLRCLSVQHIFGLEAGGRRNLAGKYAWIMLNLRLSFLSLATSKEDWTHNLAAYIVHDILNLSNAIGGEPLQRDQIQQEVEKVNSPAIFLLLTSASRVLIRSIIRQIRHAIQLSLAALKSTATAETSKAYPTFLTILNITPIPIQHLDSLLADVDSLARKTYANAQKTDSERAIVEKTMLITCELPEVLTPVVQHLLTIQLDKLKDEIDPARIVFSDLRWLNLTEDHRTRDFNKDRCFDVIQKTFVKPDVPLRQCTRCGAHTVDINAVASKSYGTWLHNAQKTCVCGNQWLTISTPGSAAIEGV